MQKQAGKIIGPQMSSKVQCFIFQPRLNTHIFEKRLQYFRFYMYKSKYQSVLSKHTPGFRKHKSNIDMANNYVLFSRFY